MTTIEIWELNRTTVRDAFIFSKEEHKKEKCIDGSKMNWKKDNSFCECFNRSYHSRWQEILKDE